MTSTSALPRVSIATTRPALPAPAVPPAAVLQLAEDAAVTTKKEAEEAVATIRALRTYRDLFEEQAKPLVDVYRSVFEELRDGANEITKAFDTADRRLREKLARWVRKTGERPDGVTNGRSSWRVKVTDFEKVPEQFWVVDEDALKKLAAERRPAGALDGPVELVPGVTVEEVPTMAVGRE